MSPTGEIINLSNPPPTMISVQAAADLREPGIYCICSASISSMVPRFKEWVTRHCFKHKDPECTCAESRTRCACHPSTPALLTLFVSTSFSPAAVLVNEGRRQCKVAFDAVIEEITGLSQDALQQLRPKALMDTMLSLHGAKFNITVTATKSNGYINLYATTAVRV